MLGGEKVERPELAKHDASVLDLAFVMDCTGSMGSYIANATESIRNIVEEIVSMEKSDVNLALVEYRDHPPQESSFVTRSHDFTPSVSKMREWLSNCSAQGGGDEPEAVADGLQDALNLSWREKATKICIIISDAPPHGIGSSGDSMPNGCPKGIDPIKVVDQLAKKGVTLYTVGCEPSLLPYKQFFSALAYKTGGQYVPLRNAKLLAKVIVGGAVEEISLERLIADVEAEVKEQQSKGIINEAELAAAVQSKLSSKGVKTNHISINSGKLEGASEEAKKYSKMSDLSELRSEYKPSYSGAGAPSGAATYHSRRAAAPIAMESAFAMADDLSGAPSAASSAVEETYGVVNTDIDYTQSERLVQKVLNRKKE